MRTLVLTRGAPGCGKSTWIREQGLEEYALSADNIRLLYQSPELSPTGSLGISQKNDAEVWSLLHTLLERRMARGEFIVVDATHMRTAGFSPYKKLMKQYRYRAYVVDFTTVSRERCHEQNVSRPPVKQVPSSVVDLMYERALTETVPGGFTVIKPEEFQEKVYLKPVAMDEYDTIHVIGDIQGCFTPLQRYFKENPYTEDRAYIFVGDICDRGPQNVEVLRFMLEFSQKPNVYVVDSNHDRHLWEWANGRMPKSREFLKRTMPEFEAAAIDRVAVREYYRRVAQMFYFVYRDQEYLVSHGGLTGFPCNPVLIAADEYVFGSGPYGTPVDMIYSENYNRSMNWPIQIHGHRNVSGIAGDLYPSSINLEGRVEFGGSLRIACLGEIERAYMEYPNSHIRSNAGEAAAVDA